MGIFDKRTKSNVPTAPQPVMTLDYVFGELQRYGRLNVHQFAHNGGYKVSISNKKDGVSIDISSDLEHKALLDAAMLCLRRCQNANGR